MLSGDDIELLDVEEDPRAKAASIVKRNVQSVLSWMTDREHQMYQILACDKTETSPYTHFVPLCVVEHTGAIHRATAMQSPTQNAVLLFNHMAGMCEINCNAYCQPSPLDDDAALDVLVRTEYELNARQFKMPTFASVQPLFSQKTAHLAGSDQPGIAKLWRDAYDRLFNELARSKVAVL